MKVTPEEIIKKADAEFYDFNENGHDKSDRIAQISSLIISDLVNATAGLMEKCTIMPGKVYEGADRPIKSAEEAIKQATGINYKFGITKILKDE